MRELTFTSAILPILNYFVLKNKNHSNQRMKFRTIAFIFIVSPSLLFSQHVFKERIGPCNTSPSFALESDSITTKRSSEELLNEICNSIPSKTLRKLRGTISMQVIVDTLGTPCLMSVENNLNQFTDELGLTDIINHKTKWAPPIKEGKKEKVAVLFKISFKKELIAIQRIGYNAKTGMRELDKYVLQR